MDIETIFAILVGAALACFSLVLVGYSFFRGNAAQKSESNGTVPEDDGIGMDAILDSIDTLELEYQLGNVTEDEYRQQLQSYRQQLARAVRAQLEQGDASPELVLEQEVLRARREGAAGWQSCPQCDAPLPKSAGLDVLVLVCPHCNAPLDNGHSLPSQDAAGVALPAQAE